MNRPRLASLFAHLALALSGVCLACAEVDFLLETLGLLVVYLALVWQSWRNAGSWVLSVRGANVLGAVITVVATVWIVLRFQTPEVQNWIMDVPISVALVPYLGPVLMALMMVRLFRPREPGDFWVLQGMGLLQVALGCVLANGSLFGAFLLLYLIAAVCAVAAHEEQRQTAQSAAGPIGGAPASVLGWLAFSLWWTTAVAACALPIFFFTPRLDGPEEWDPFTRFLARSRARITHTGFSDEINLNRVGQLEIDDTVVFTVSVTDYLGRPYRDLPLDQRWRGVVLDRYDDGHLRSDLNWSSGKHVARPTVRPAPTANTLHVEFKVPGAAGGLFLAEPIPLGPVPGVLPVWVKESQDYREKMTRLFYEADGSFTAFSNLLRKEYRYVQALLRSDRQDRTPAVRLRDSYQGRILRLRTPGMEAFTRDVLLQLTERPGAWLRQLRAKLVTHPVPPEPLPPEYWEGAARLLNNYLARSGEYRYSLVSRREVLTLDPVLDFLVNVKEGRCEHYASALTLMLRSVGVPARVVKGFRGVESNGDGTYQVRQSHAHAWVEALVAGDGDNPSGFDWVMLDPTPDVEGQRAVSTLTRLRQLQQSGQALWQSLIVGYNSREQADLWDNLVSGDRLWNRLSWLAGGLVAMLAIVLVRGRKLWRRRGPAGVAALYDRLRRVVGRRLHVEARSDETPRELAARATEVLRRREGLAGVVAVPGQLVELLYRVRYGGETLPAEVLAEAGGRLEALESALER